MSNTDEERVEAFENIYSALEGLDIGTVALPAIFDFVVFLLATRADDIHTAEAMIDANAKKMKLSLHLNWEQYNGKRLDIN